jgi:hypothetical protein
VVTDNRPIVLFYVRLTVCCALFRVKFSFIIIIIIIIIIICRFIPHVPTVILLPCTRQVYILYMRRDITLMHVLVQVYLTN